MGTWSFVSFNQNSHGKFIVRLMTVSFKLALAQLTSLFSTIKCYTRSVLKHLITYKLFLIVYPQERVFPPRDSRYEDISTMPPSSTTRSRIRENVNDWLLGSSHRVQVGKGSRRYQDSIRHFIWQSSTKRGESETEGGRGITIADRTRTEPGVQTMSRVDSQVTAVTEGGILACKITSEMVFDDAAC